MPCRIASRIQEQGLPVVDWKVAGCMRPGKQEEGDEPPAGSDLAASDSVHEARELSDIWQKNLRFPTETD